MDHVCNCLLLLFLVAAQDYYLFVGTYTAGPSKGIYVIPL